MSAEVIPLSTRLSVRVPAELAQRVEGLANAYSVPGSTIVRWGVENFVNGEMTGNADRARFNRAMAAIHQIGAPPADEANLGTAS